MYTSYIGYRISLALIFSVLFVIPAAAQQTFGNTTALLTAENSANGVRATETISTIIQDVAETEFLPLEPPVLTSLEWAEFGNRLEAALASEHKGLQNSALRLIIAYGDRLELVESAVFDIMRLYRDGDTDRVRRMAVVALAQVRSDWAIKFLERSVRFEQSPQIQHTIRAILSELNGSSYRA